MVKDIPVDYNLDENNEILGVHQALNTSRYLGLPSMIGRRKKSIFHYVKERVWKKLQAWRTKNLSRAGKEVLIKVVAQAIPSFCMSTFLLPSTLLDELHRMMNAFFWTGGGTEGKGIKWLKWERLCVPRVMGGRGFRNLHLFNVAFLGKFAWRLINDPNALVCKVLRAKYYPNGSFLDATKGSIPSFSWVSIMEAQDLIRRGTRWKVGDGANIRVWGQPWLEDEGSFYIHTPRQIGMENLKVKELIIPGTCMWNMQLINQLFQERDRKAILQTPISSLGCKDRLIWHYAKDGKYSVKSAYKLADNLTQREDYVAEGDWRLVWNMQVPPKVRDFVWRACRNVLPTRDNLNSKGMQVESTCVQCGGGPESAWHVLFNCPFAWECWRLLGLEDTLEHNILRVESFSELIFVMLNELSTDRRTVFAMGLWQIWKERNMLVWEENRREPSRAMADVNVQIHEWRNLRSSTVKSSRTQQPCKAWHRPVAGTVKVNTDAAFFEATGEVGVGFIVQDEEGGFIAARTRVFPGRFDVDIGEGIGFLEALSWIKQRGVENVTIEGDSKRVVDAINAEEVAISSFGDIIQACKNLVNSISGCNISFVQRSANYLAHSLAKASRDYVSPCLWVELPSFVASLPAVECTCGS